MKAISISIFLLSSIAISTVQSAFAQQTTYSQEDSSVTTSELKRVYRYITRANVEEKTLIKLGFWPNAGDRDYSSRPTFRIGLNVDASIERKITPSFSVLAGFDLSAQYNTFDRLQVPFDRLGNGQFIDIDKTFRTFLATKVGTRYYYAMAKRMKTGKSANNFSGNYVGLQVATILSVRSRTYYYDSKTGQTLPSGISNYIMYDGPLVSAMWGIQRRLGRRGFVDINAGPELTIPPKDEPVYYLGTPTPLPVYKNGKQPSLSLRVNAVIGLGW